MITILYIYKDKDILRVHKSLISLQKQNNKDFQVLFIDFGSNDTFSSQIQAEITQFKFVEYHYSYHQNQPWSRGKAINIGIKLLKTDYVFIADIDIIFKENFVDVLYSLKNPKKSIYFKVGFLNQVESLKELPFDEYKIKFESGVGAQGLSLFPTQALKYVCGFDEFLHFWGSEDEDIHNRLINYGLEEVFYNKEILMLHQWHKTYRKAENNDLSTELRISNIAKINESRLQFNKDKLRIIVNSDWGRIVNKDDYDFLINYSQTVKIKNRKEHVDHFLFSELPTNTNKVISVEFFADDFEKSLKYKIKKLLKKSVPEFYTLKEINDKVLLLIISFYHNYNYIYKVSNDKKSIKFTINKS